MPSSSNSTSPQNPTQPRWLLCSQHQGSAKPIFDLDLLIYIKHLKRNVVNGEKISKAKKPAANANDNKHKTWEAES